jgi:hypothetical protein
MKAYGGVNVWIHIFLTYALTGVEWSASRLCRFTPGERAPGTHWIGGWVDPRAGLDDLEKRKFFTLSGLELRPLSRPASSQSLYRLRYPSSVQKTLSNKHIAVPYILKHHDKDVCGSECKISTIFFSRLYVLEKKPRYSLEM